MLEANPDDIVVTDDGRRRRRGRARDARSPWAQLAAQRAARRGRRTSARTARPSRSARTSPSSRSISTPGRVTPIRHVAVDDCGRILNPLIVAGQQHGGIAQGIAQALWEQYVYDADGNPLTSTLTDYAMPSAAELPSFEASNTETPSPRNPLGAKGIGESGTIGSTPAVQSAVVDALAHLGVRHIDIPCTPERVWAAIRDAEAGIARRSRGASRRAIFDDRAPRPRTAPTPTRSTSEPMSRRWPSCSTAIPTTSSCTRRRRPRRGASCRRSPTWIAASHDLDGQAIGVLMPERARHRSPRGSASGGRARAFVPLNPRAPDAEIERAIERTGVAAVVTAGRAADVRTPATPRVDRSRRRDHPVHVGHDRRAEGRRAAPRHRVGAARHRDRRRCAATAREQGAHAEHRPDVAVVVGRHLPGAVRVQARRARRADGRSSNRPSSRGSSREYEIRSSVLPPAALVMLLQDPAVTTLEPLRYVRSVSAPLSPVVRAPLPRALRHRDAQRLRPDRARRRGGRLDRGRLEGARRAQARRRSAVRTPRSSCASAATDGDARADRRGRRARDPLDVGAAARRRRDGGPRHRRRLAAHRRPRAHRRRGLRVDQRPRRAR